MRTPAFVATAAGIFASLAAFAQGPVYSVNIVGFQKVAATNLFTQVSNPFVQADSSVNAVIGNQGTAATLPENADQILIWTGTTYRSLYLSSITSPPEFLNKWVEFDENSGELAVSTATVPAGVGFWFQNAGATNTVTVVGDVEMAATKTVAIQPGFNMISYPYSTSTAFNTAAMNLDGAAGVLGNAAGSLDKIFIWNGSAYVELVYITGGSVPELNDKWAFFNENTGELELANQVIEPGESFWYFRSGATGFNWTTTKPY